MKTPVDPSKVKPRTGRRRLARRVGAALSIAMALAAAAACSSVDEDESLGEKHQLMVVHSVLDFEDPGKWTANSGQLSASSEFYSGAGAVRLDLTSYTQVESTPLASLGAVGDNLSLRLRLDSPVSWGEARVVLKAPSLGIYWGDLGGVQLSGQAPGEFHALSFTIAESLRNALNGSPYDDLTITVVLNGPAGGYTLDSLHLTNDPPPVPAPEPPPSFDVLTDALEAGALVAATEWLEIGDRASLIDSGVYAPATNSGDGILRVGSEANVGALWSVGQVDLRDRANVHGDIHADDVTQGNPVSVSGEVVPDALGGSLNVFPTYNRLEPIAPGAQLPDVALEPNDVVTLGPGYYGDVSVKTGARLELQGSGADYSFGAVIIEPGATIEVDAACGAARIEVRDTFIFRGSLVESQGDDAGVGATIFYTGTETAHVEAPFRGIIMAPEAELILNSSHHKGKFLAARLRVQPDAVVEAVAPAGELPRSCYGESDEGEEEFTPTPADIGPAPTLLGVEDVDAFLEWFYRIRAAEIEEARTQVGNVTNNPDVVAALVARFGTTRANEESGKSLMLLNLIGSFAHVDAENFLIALAQEAVTGQDDDQWATSVYDLEVSYRVKAFNILAGRESLNAWNTVKGVAVNSTNLDLRQAAIRALATGQSASVIAELRTEIADDDEHELERPHITESNFDTKFDSYMQSYDTEN